jgi:hypothetical protein
MGQAQFYIAGMTDLSGEMALLQRRRSMQGRGHFATTLTTLQTAYSFTGKGHLKCILAKNGDALANYSIVKVTVDGNVWIWGKTVSSNGGMQSSPSSTLFSDIVMDGSAIVFSSTGSSADMLPEHASADFKESLKIEVMSSNVAMSAHVYWIVEVE